MPIANILSHKKNPHRRRGEKRFVICGGGANTVELDPYLAQGSRTA